MKKVYVVALSLEEQSQLTRLTMQGKEAVRKVKRAHILLQADAGRSDEAIAEQVGVSVPTVGRIRRTYAEGGVEAALAEKPRSGRPPGISGETRAKVTALACSAPPEGRSRWPLRLLAAKVVELIDAAYMMGATSLVGPLYSAPGRFWLTTTDERARDVDRLVRQLSHLSAYASDHGITLCIEPLNRFHTSFMNLAAQAIEVIDRVHHPACQILLDTVHMNIEEKSFGDAIRATGARLRHFHVCENDGGAPGSGHIPWQAVAQALHDIQYDGPVVIESFTDKVAAVALAAAAWRPVAASQDALARDGLAFLQLLFHR